MITREDIRYILGLAITIFVGVLAIGAAAIVIAVVIVQLLRIGVLR